MAAKERVDIGPHARDGTSSLNWLERGRSRWTYLAHTRAGSVILSIDFLLAIPVAVAAGALITFADKASGQAGTILLAVTALLATLTGIVMAAHTILVSLLSAEYLIVLERASGGLRAVSRPYKIVIWVCAIGVLVSLLSALAWPILPASSTWYWRAARWTIFGTSIFMAVWGLIGSVQLAGQSAWHLEQRAKLLKLLRDTREDLKRSNGRRSA
ncbi:hypothetical protein OG792_02815 [Micromonospora sp. NBC_01699]|uniref:hypothetical protein n=1 Tax=Micromonospora sp. NBC_01699 TaxID=2975984 RepID=UPI002E2BAB9A|nr:hypothetical protein [Micromonospora sp. NBC_01699]